jgi:hypothetical protein
MPLERLNGVSKRVKAQTLVSLGAAVPAVKVPGRTELFPNWHLASNSGRRAAFTRLFRRGRTEGIGIVGNPASPGEKVCFGTVSGPARADARPDQLVIGW